MRTRVLESVATAARGRKRRGTGRVKLLLLLGVFLLGFAPRSVHAQAEWEIQTVNHRGGWFSMAERNLRIDAGGSPHIACLSHGIGLEHAWQDGTIWRYETVDDSSDIGERPSLAIDESDNLHISYLCNGLKYAYWNGIEWHMETIESFVTQWAYNTSLALDGNGYPHISYNDGDLKYAYWDGSGWHIETVDVANSRSSLALDEADFPHICYIGENTLRHVFWDGSGWHNEAVYTSSNHYFGPPSMVLDETGAPHISFRSDDEGPAVHYAHKVESSWQVTSVDQMDYWGYSSIALDESGNPNISYATERLSGSVLNHAAWDGSEWNIQTVVPAFSFPFVYEDDCIGISLTLDGSGSPCISFLRQMIDHDGVNSNVLSYAQWNDDSWDVEIIEGAGYDGEYNSLALDQMGRPHIGYRANELGEFFGNLQYAYWDGSEWLREALDDGPISGWEASLALDVSDQPHICDFDPDGSFPLRYTWKDESGWGSENLNTHSLDGATSLAVDSFGFPHVSYWEYHQDLRYARKDETGWHHETVDAVSSEYGQDHMCLTLDAADSPHLSYIVFGLLKYAFKDAEGWHIQTVDDEAWGGWFGYTSLAFDAEGHPHISYNGGPMADIEDVELRHAHWTGSDWLIETVDSSGIVRGSRFMALDSYGYPHISYWSDNAKKYAYWNGLNWQIETVGSSVGLYRFFSSLALDDTNLAHISFAYYESDLKYAHRLSGSINMSIAQDNGQFILSWAGYPGANAYWIYGAANQPYFVPGIGPGPEHRLDIIPPGTTTWQTTNGIADPANNWAYLVLAVGETEQELARSNRAGEHDFRVDIP